MAKLLPRIVYKMAVHGAYIVGSNAKKLIGQKVQADPKDWDILVPMEKWQTIAMLIPSSAKPNKFGGWRFMSEGIEIDVWPDSVENYLKNCKTSHGGEVVAVDFINNKVYASRFADI